MITKIKQKPKNESWREYRSLILWIALWLGFAQFILAFDPIVLNITTPFEAQAEFAMFTVLVSFWMLIAYCYGRKWGFSRKWMLICVAASLITMLMLTIEQNYRYFPSECVYEPLGKSFLLIRIRLDCGQLLYFPLF
jgi:hypothetical protein